MTVSLCCLALFFGFLLGSGAGPGSPNKKTSIFSLGEITRLMKFPGVGRTFIVKIVAGLPSGEMAQLDCYKICALGQMNMGRPLIFFLLYFESCFFSSQAFSR